MEGEVKCVISGAFKRAKARMDEIHDYFEGSGIKVLSPSKGGLFYPRDDVLWTPESYPLQSELYISELEAKKRHLREIDQADFLYVVDPGGYLGESGALETGWAYGRLIPIYCEESVDPTIDSSPRWFDHIRILQVKSPEEVVRIWKEVGQRSQRGLYLPRRFAFGADR